MVKVKNRKHLEKIFIAADHAGFVLKEKLKKYLQSSGFEVQDLGNFALDPDDDYPDFMVKVASAVAENPLKNRGIVIGGSGQGEAMVANKIKKIRAALVYDNYSAKMSREHNDANVMSIGARTLDSKTAKKLVMLWLKTPFRNEVRHQRRIDKISQLEK